jgi:hypothetical protein
MSDTRANPPCRRHVSPWAAAVLWLVMVAPLARWGLPDRSRDDLLFGGEPAWPAERFGATGALAELRTRAAGADTDRNPRGATTQPLVLTSDEQARGEILTAYRLYSRQPDEMITFRALVRMKPRDRDFDPQLYQYGGGYIYAVGAALAASAGLNLVHLTGDVNYYLTTPEAFGDFYLVARALSLLSGALLLVAGFRLGTRAGGRTGGWLALLFVALTPVFLSGALEAKPHLPAACATLWAIEAALAYRQRPGARRAAWLGVLSGYAAALVLTGVAACASWIVLFGDRTPRTGRIGMFLRRAALVGGLALAVYAVCNPYVVYHALVPGAGALASNVQNSTAMYRIGPWGAGLESAASLLLLAAGGGLLAAGVAGLGWLLRRAAAQTLIAAAPGAALLTLTIALGAHKPAEFARFLVVPVALLAIAAAAFIIELARRSRVGALLVAAAVVLLLPTPAYIASFARDVGGTTESRYQAAQWLIRHAAPADAVAVLQEPAPYAVPPLDFSRRTVVLLPSAPPAAMDPGRLPPWLVFTADDEQSRAGEWWHTHYTGVARFPAPGTALSPITWADKPVFVYERRSDPPR